MKRRTLDLLFSAGGLALAVLLLVLGFVMKANADFAENYVHDQLSEQRISFKSADTLTDEEKKAACLVDYAGESLTSGKQAECYANEFIALHLSETADGKTYAEMGNVQTDLRTQIAAATKAGDTAKVTDLNKQLTDATSKRETLFKGETLRGLLLTSYGFSEFGVKGRQVEVVAFIVSGLLFLLSLAGFAHALRTPPTASFAEPEHTPST